MVIETASESTKERGTFDTYEKQRASCALVADYILHKIHELEIMT